MPDFSGLNPAQARAVLHPGGPALVLAGPGSGKTFLIINRIRYLTECCQAAPESILVITFTRAAARSMQRRFTDAAGGRILPVTFGTFHAVFYDILKTYGPYGGDSLLTEKEKIWYLRQALRRLPGREAEWLRSPAYGRGQEDFRALLGLIGFYKNHPGAEAEDFPQDLPWDMTAEEFQTLFAAYQDGIRRDGRLDFDDMAGLCLELFRKNSGVRQKLHRRYRYILIDEYQDTNPVQDEALRFLAYPENEIFAVGDDDQAIYGFRGSAPDIMQKFGEHYPEAKRYDLTINYRSSGNIVEASVRMISANKKRFAKKLRADAGSGPPVRCLSFPDKKREYEYLTSRLKELSEHMPYTDMAVITRTNRDLERLAGQLGEAGIPCGAAERGKSRFRHFIVREIMECLEYAAKGTGSAPGIWRRLEGDERKRKLLCRQSPYAALQFLRRGIGYDEYLRKRAAAEYGETGQQSGNASGYPEEWEEILQMLSEQSRKYTGCSEWIKAVEEHISAWEERRRKTAAQADGVRLLTMHGAKGLEFAYVCLPDVNEGVLPGRKNQGEESVEEERRILYVGMTRAKKILDILYLAGTEEYPRLPSRFLNPLLAAKGISYSSSESSSSISSSNSSLSRNSSKASATTSYSSSSSI